MKLGLVSDEAGHNFTFTAPQPQALTEREKFKTELTAIIGRNRSGVASPAPHPPPVVSAVQTPLRAPSARPTVPLPRSVSRAPSASSDSHGSTPVNDPTNDFRLRKKVLRSNPELAALHRELVIGGQITEVEFWEGREVRAT